MKRLLALLVAGATIAYLLAQLKTGARGHVVSGKVIASTYRDGVLHARAVRGVDAAKSENVEGDTVVYDEVVEEGPLPTRIPVLFALSFVPTVDGVHISFEGRDEYLLPSDFIAAHLYEGAFEIKAAAFHAGVSLHKVAEIFGRKLSIDPKDVIKKASWRRIRVHRQGLAPRHFEPDYVAKGALDGGYYLGRNLDDTGHFRYLQSAVTAERANDYNWARHAATTQFLARAGGHFANNDLKFVALHAAVILRDTMTACGTHSCIATDDRAMIGDSALALLAFTELALSQKNDNFDDAIDRLSEFLRSMARADGEWQHEFDRKAGKPVDVQYPYTSGEVALALARVHRLKGRKEDLEASRRGLLYLVNRSWNFFGSQYFMGEEHWTCQAVAELWDRDPNPDALHFCERWLMIQERMQFKGGGVAFEGGFGVTPFLSPKITLAASRAEAAAALLPILRSQKSNIVGRTEEMLRRTLRFLLSHQLGPAEAHLMVRPGRMQGAFPGSPVDWELRIDYTQHAGNALISSLNALQ